MIELLRMDVQEKRYLLAKAENRLAKAERDEETARKQNAEAAAATS